MLGNYLVNITLLDIKLLSSFYFIIYESFSHFMSKRSVHIEFVTVVCNFSMSVTVSLDSLIATYKKFVLK